MNQNLTKLINLPGVQVESWHDSDHSLNFNLSILVSGIYCCYCHNYTTELHQVRPILVRDLPAFGKQVYLNLPRRQFYCRFCQRYITEQLEFINWRRKYTQRYEEMICFLANNSTIEQVSEQENLSIEQVKNIVNHLTHHRKTNMAFR
ncbi:transposase family protein [Aphanizomenon sp. CS-733/32]|uniref:transposase family protein n=1 Tax=Aphanizomenon sp. CS-733/32 TaxID=3021715 RepID=UPI00232D0A6A|nr:transposase family protein [Aphanizomenon sp. CS-733/32]MDB9309975.1 transposase family protein [Aphanizomenon sp. CS-733/32]